MPLQFGTVKRELLWSGSFFVHHSLALVNRELTLALLRNERFAERYELNIDHYEPPQFGAEADGRFAELEARLGRQPVAPLVTIRHKWPPEFTAPATGKLVLIQPWEFGSIPASWMKPLREEVDEIWVPSNFVRNCYIESGAPPQKIMVVPNGVNTARFHPGVVPFDFSTHPQLSALGPDTYKFLFVGGTIARKGVDILLEAYARAFSAKDDVVLIVKDFGADSFYANQGAGALIRALQERPSAPRVIHLTDDLSEDAVASLYAACDCLAHPYRGEGYGLPIAEAMACGKPVLVTHYGAALDFVNPTNSYLIDARVHRHNEKRIGDLATVDFPFWAEPDREALVEAMRHVVVNREEAQGRGAQASRDIQTFHTWDLAAHTALNRLEDLTEAMAGAGFSLPMGLGGLSLGSLQLGALNNLSGAPGEQALGAAYETRKQAALRETRMGDWEHAGNDLDACLSERSDDIDVINALAVSHFRSGRVDRALELLWQGLAQAPESRDLHHNLAFILLESGQPSEALTHALAALTLTPGDVNLKRTVERVRDAVLKEARKILRAAPAQERDAAKKDPKYRALMALYTQAEEALAAERNVLAPLAESLVVTPPSFSEGVKGRLSLCMIVKNEARFLRSCLESAREVVDEIVVVDTGSTDATKEIAREFGAKIVEAAWTDDFSAARNTSLDHATGDWALWLDADEEIAPGIGPRIREVISGAPDMVGAYMIKIRNWLTSPTRNEGSDMAVHHACRLFRRLPGVRFEGRIHEQNLRTLQQLGYTYQRDESIVIDHFGYAHEIMSLRNKHERFISMLKREVDECPDSGFRQFHLFNLGNAYFTSGDMENAAHYFSLAAEDADAREEYAVTLFVEWASAMHRLQRPYEGLEVCERADALGIRQAGVEFARGYCLLHLEQYEAAEEAFRMAVEFRDADAVAFAETGDSGVTGYKSFYGLALSLVGQDRHDEALPYCDEALEQQAGMADALYLRALILARQDRTAEARRDLQFLLELQPNHVDAIKDLSALLFSARDYEEALPYLLETARRNPSDFELQARVAVAYEELSRFDEARDAYEMLRLLAPDSAEICVNLGRVLAETGAEAEAIDCYADAIQLAPDYGNAYFNAGDLLYKMGYYEKAVDTYMSGLEVEPKHDSGFFVLGNCYFQLGSYAAAVACYRQAMVMQPDHPEAQHNLDLAEEMVALQQAA